MAQTLRLTSPRGRFVQGDAFEPQTKDQQGNPLTIKTGPNAGQPTKRWFMAVAYPKNHPETLPYLMQLAQLAAQSWPMYFPNGATPTPPLFGCTHPRFAMKIMDGDGMDDNGKPNAGKEGFAGHWVVKYSTAVAAPGVWQEPNFDEMARINDPRMLPRGYYVRINHGTQSNENDQRPGLFVNLDKVAICADQNGASIIQSGPTAAEAFGGQTITTSYAVNPPAPAGGALIAKPGVDLDAYRRAGWTDEQLVQHGHATRAAPAPLPAPTPAAPPPAPIPAASTPPAVPVPAPVTPSPSSPPAPYAGYIPATPPVPGAPAPAPVPAPAARVMLPAANGATYEAMIAAGWTDAMLVHHGMMAP